jgi:2-keto-4-pentenoate hydratase
VDTAAAERLAGRLDEAWEQRIPIEPLSETEGLDSVDDAYAIQACWTELRLARGETIDGRKIGLTSRAMQQQMGVDQPDFGTLWSSRAYPAQDGRVSVSCAPFVQAKLEGELAFLIAEEVCEPEVSPERALAVTEAVAPAFEIVDSRIRDWRIKLVDTVADNASYGGYTLGPWRRSLRDGDLAAVAMTLERNGERVVEALGSAALGHPARAVAWLLSTLGRRGVGVRPGDVVLSGSLGGAIEVAPGDVFVLAMADEPELTMTFTD